MARAIHVFRTPDRFVAGTVGQPGNRTFYLQAVHDSRVVSVVLEKQQVAVLAERIGALLFEVNRRFGTPVPRNPLRSTTSAPDHAGGCRVSGRDDGAGLGFGGAERGGRTAGRHRRGVRRFRGARRHRGRARRGAGISDAGVRPTVRYSVLPRHLCGTPAVPALR